ncbi:hypothetical protein AB0E88_05250 [Streptomyces sp. NPDC028635]|uniref:hypothetical protein n=1 Tax=Streptomyces sp. NPDC028635 TaxID=3154800 RepID=UPI0033C5A4C4
MSQANKGTDQKSDTTKPASAARSRGAAGKRAASAASRGLKKAEAKAGDGVSTARTGAGRAADEAAGAVNVAAKGLDAGRRAVVTASGQVGTVAKTAWTVIARRKLVAVGVGAGATALSAASYALGRRSSRGPQGPLTRLTGGRI